MKIMQTYLFLNKSTREVTEQQFCCFEQLEKFIEANENFELIDERFNNLPFRGTRIIG